MHVIDSRSPRYAWGFWAAILFILTLSVAMGRFGEWA
jgi:hypothetical protein